MTAAPYEPLDVYKPVAPGIGVVDGPFEYLTVAGVRLPLPFPTRMTVVRLSNGDLFLHSPTRFEPRLAEQLALVGRIRHLVSPNQFHYAHIGEWQQAFPDALAWASPGVRARSKARHVRIRFDRDLEPQAPGEWRDDLDQALFPGGYFKEFIFFHRESGSLIVTDAIMNFELDRMDQPWRTLTRISGMYHPHGQVFFGMRLPLLLQRRKTAAAAARVREWRPRRILLAHGRCFETGADDALDRVFGNSARMGP
jgi:hypothetical protein